MLDDKPYLQRVTFQRDQVEQPEAYPFNLPILRHLDTIDFHPDVTFLVGENGSGKSTLIEAIALHMGFGPEGGTKNFALETAHTTSELHQYIRSSRSFRPPSDHYFLRAESFYNVATYMDTTGYLRGYGGKSLHEQSHGEAFFAVLVNKLIGHGLYIFDEPEAALSPARQLSAVSAIHRLVQAKSQFIIATHSPIILAYPNAKILALSETGIEEVDYEETDTFKMYDMFFRNYKGLIDQIIREED